MQLIAKLNLASQPFRNRALPWAVSVVVSLVSLLALVYFVAESRRAATEAEVAERQVETLRAERGGLEAQAAQIKESIPPEQLKTLEAAHLLVERKSFSWSRLFSDLEDTLPSSVRVGRINVRDVANRGEQTRAELDLTVVGRNPADVTGMIDDMRRLGAFSAIPINELQKSGKGESGYEWTLRVSYVQSGRRPVRGDNSGDAAERNVSDNVVLLGTEAAKGEDRRQ